MRESSTPLSLISRRHPCGKRRRGRTTRSSIILLTIGLRVLTRLQFVVCRRLAESGSVLAGLYAGNPKRATAQPTAERLLEAFDEITLTLVGNPSPLLRHLTPLSPLQLRILAL